MKPPFPIKSFLSLLLFACHSDSDSDHLKEAKEKWTTDQKMAIQWLEKQDPVIQIAAFQKIISEDPQAIIELCEAPNLNALKQHCSLVKDRPHLTVNPQKHNRKQPISLLPKANTEESPLLSISPKKDTGCTPQDDLVCIFEAAQKSALDSPKETAAYCNVLTGHTRSECYFNAADYLKGNEFRIDKQLELCQAAQPYGDNCLAHLKDQFVRGVKSISDLDRATFNELQTLQNYFSQSQISWHQDFAAIFWAETTFFMLKKTEPLCSKPLEKLPAALKPHWQAALVFFQYKKSHPPSTVEERFQKQKEWSEIPCTNSERSLSDRTEVRFYWQNNYMLTNMQSNQLPYLRKSLRAYSVDPQIDSELIWLEAAAQHDDWNFVDEMRQSPVPEVSKRAAQLSRLRKNYQVFP